jgi:hypothetical protein
MTPQEFQYIKRAVEALEGDDLSLMSRAKVLMTVSEICSKNATTIRQQLEDAVDARMARNYQDIQNQRLVDILSQ